MSNVKFGLKQASQPAPLGWRRFERAYMIGLAPAVATYLTGWGFEAALLAKLLLTLTFVGSLVKTVGVFLGNGTEYAPRKEEPTTP